jgi:hypothetical protein
MGTPVKNICIPDSVISIAGDTIHQNRGAFSYCSKLETVVIGDGLKTIAERVFHNCTSLTSITIGSSVASIQQNAFLNCSSLSEIVIPSSVISIGEDAFRGCNALQKVTFHEGLQSIGKGAFMGTPITSICIPTSVTSIAGDTIHYKKGAFANCTKLETIILGTGITKIREYSFYNCSSIKQVHYTGTEDQWNAVYFEGGNDYLKKAPITFNYKPE